MKQIAPVVWEMLHKKGASASRLCHCLRGGVQAQTEVADAPEAARPRPRTVLDDALHPVDRRRYSFSGETLATMATRRTSLFTFTPLQVKYFFTSSSQFSSEAYLRLSAASFFAFSPSPSIHDVSHLSLSLPLPQPAFRPKRQPHHAARARRRFPFRVS